MIAQLSTKAIEPLRWLMVAGIAYTLATSVLYFLAAPEAEPIASAPGATPSKSTTPAYNINTLLSRNLFGAYDPAPVAAASSEPVVETRLPLELQGVFVAERPEESVAIVAQKNKPGQLYRVGDKVPGNAELIEVYEGYIVLRRAGVRETLKFPTTIEAGQFVANADPADDPAEGAYDSEAMSAEQLVENYREMLQDDPDSALEKLGVEPVSVGEAAGYRLESLDQAPYLTQTGLKPGDVILSVNGRPVGDVNQDQQQLQDLLAEGVARLEVQRGDRRFFVTASLK